MSLPLHKVPRGFLELIRARTLGRAPDSFAEQVAGVVVMNDFYGSDLHLTSAAQTGASAISAILTTTTTEPQRQIALGAVIIVGAAAGTRLTVAVDYAPNAAMTPVTLLAQSFVAPILAAGQTLHAAIVLPGGLVVGPGAQFRCITSGDAAGADHNILLRTVYERYSPTN